MENLPIPTREISTQVSRELGSNPDPEPKSKLPTKQRDSNTETSSNRSSFKRSSGIPGLDHGTCSLQGLDGVSLDEPNSTKSKLSFINQTQTLTKNDNMNEGPAESQSQKSPKPRPALTRKLSKNSKKDDGSKIPIPKHRKSTAFTKLRKVSVVRKKSKVPLKSMDSEDFAVENVELRENGKENRMSKLRPFTQYLADPPPPLPEKSLKFKKLQYERMLAGKINNPPEGCLEEPWIQAPKNGKEWRRHDIKALLVQIKNSLKSEENQIISIYDKVSDI